MNVMSHSHVNTLAMTWSVGVSCATTPVLNSVRRPIMTVSPSARDTRRFAASQSQAPGMDASTKP